MFGKLFRDEQESQKQKKKREEKEDQYAEKRRKIIEDAEKKVHLRSFARRGTAAINAGGRTFAGETGSSGTYDLTREGAIEALKSGQETWAAWRKAWFDTQGANALIPLNGVDFCDPRIFGGSVIWRDAFGGHEHHTDVDFLANDSRLHPAGADLNGYDLSDVDFSGANLSHANLAEADLRSSKFDEAKLHCAVMAAAQLQFASFRYADLTSANLYCAFLRRTMLGRAKLDAAYIHMVDYDRKDLVDMCLGVEGAERLIGDAHAKRDILDQEFIDSRRVRLGAEAQQNKQPIAFAKNILLGVFAALVFLILSFFGDISGIAKDLSVENAVRFAQTKSQIFIGTAFLFSFVGLLFSGSQGRWNAFRLWSLFDYGRDWDRVVLFGAVWVVVFAIIYAFWVPEGVAYVSAIDDVAIKPVFLSAMAFLTLGIVDIATPKNDFVAVLMMLNVLSGFLTLGLLLAVLTNIFARRSNG